ncbi:MAG: hypothetical protein HRU72_08090 [Planctomycetia bacterium]|nr:MAG: hypothetical protein HRU72_08090 [Planctomycetia bacterium]HQU32473.1 hypothetical protein [Candidatus Brocadia sapporoensis]
MRWSIRKKGVKSEKEFSTYGMGMQVSHGMSAEEETQNHLWNTLAGDRNNTAEVV